MNIDCTVLHHAKLAVSAIGAFLVLFGYINSAQGRKFSHCQKGKSIISRLCVFISNNK